MHHGQLAVCIRELRSCLYSPNLDALTINALLLVRNFISVITVVLLGSDVIPFKILPNKDVYFKPRRHSSLADQSHGVFIKRETTY
jgi:hypothetical protein